jgi:subtilase family serine protease
MKGFVKLMRNLRIQSVLGLLILVIVACTSKSKPPPNAKTSEPSPLFVQSTSESDRPSQPDLIINFMYLEMEGRQGTCVNAYSPYGIRVQIKNIGSANTGPFFVDLNGTLQEVKYGLLVGQSIELHFAGTISSGQYEATADVTNQVIESREENNTFSFLAPTPTPPPLCVATVTATP